MENKIITYLSKYTLITPELEQAIKESVCFKYAKKGTLLLQKGEIANECFFIIKGCVRCFYVKDGDEKTTEFYTEEQSVTPISYGKNTPSEYYLECIEDTVVGIGNPELEREMYEKFPVLIQLNQAIGEAIIAKQTQEFAEFKMASPEERYMQLLKHKPDLLQRAPQHQIASYLGIKPESLSRIRKRIS